MNITKSQHLDTAIRVIKIQEQIIIKSNNVDKKSKEAFLALGKYWLERLNVESFTITQLKSVIKQILTYWNESVSLETELFWSEVKNENLPLIRRDELIFALNKNRFRRVDIGMSARKDWSKIFNLNSIKERFSNEEIKKITEIIEFDESKRLEILTKCHKKNKIPQTYYLKFGECMAYFANCDLFEKYFSKNETEELYNIWKNS